MPTTATLRVQPQVTGRELAGQPRYLEYALGLARSWARGRPADREEYEEAALLALHLAGERYDPDRGASFESWLNVMLKWRFRDVRKYGTIRRGRLPIDRDLGPETVANTVDPHGDDTAAARSFREEIARLPALERLVVWQHLALDMTFPEIARELGCKGPHAAYLYYRAIGRLRAHRGLPELSPIGRAH